MGAGLNLRDVDVAILRAVAILVVVGLILLVVGHVHGHRLHVSECLLRLLLQRLIVEEFLGLLHGPLQLPREDRGVVVALQAIAVRENVDGKLGRGDPEAAVAHGRKSNGQAASATSDVFRRLSLLCRRLDGRRVGSLLPGGLRLSLLLFLLSFQAVDAIGHALEQRRQGFHRFALILRDVEDHRGSLPKGCREARDAGLLLG